VADELILYYIFNLILSIFWLIFWKNFDTLNYISNIGLSTSSGAKHNQMDEFWSNSSWRTLIVSKYQTFPPSDDFLANK
ncbi:unnamed protein product, partial [Prunus brigantina]